MRTNTLPHQQPPRSLGSASPPKRYRERKDTVKLSALSVNLRRKRHPKIWGHEGLPSDCHALYAVPRGGALVVGQNLLLYYTQGTQVCGVLPPGEIQTSARDSRDLPCPARVARVTVGGRLVPRCP
jgi:hypothetical protein